MTRCPMSRRSQAFGTLALALAIQGGAADARAAIVGGRELYRASHLDTFPEWRVHTGYARGIVTLGQASALGGKCTGFLIADSVMVTAQHCVAWALDTDSARDVSYANFAWGEPQKQMTMARAKSLGLEGLALQPGGYFDTLRYTQGTCRFVLAEGSRDTALYACDRIRLDNGKWVYPGQFWGHLKVRTGLIDEGQRVWALGVPQGSDRPDENGYVMVSTHAEVLESRAESSLGWDNLFATTVDVFKGMSGGPILNAHFEAVGTISSGNSEWTTGGYLGTAVAACARDASAESCLAAQDTRPTLRPSFSSLTSGTRAGSPLADPARTVASACPEGQLAIGVVYQKRAGAEAALGTFALVCAYPRADTFELDNATIASAGTVGQDDDSGAPSMGAGHVSFNTYVHERVRQPDNQPGTLQLCGPGYALNSVTTEVAAGTVRKVLSITCRPVTDAGIIDYQPGRRRVLSVEAPTLGAAQAVFGCAAADAVRGLVSSRSTSLASVQARCARAE